jgi:hypothetical protein
VAFFALVILFFCPWITVPPKNGVLLTQNGFQVAFGRAEGRWPELTTDSQTKTDAGTRPAIRASALGILYFFLIALGCVLGVLITLATVLDWPELRPYLRFRQLIMGGLGLATALILLMQLLAGFPAVDAWSRVDKPSDKTLEEIRKVFVGEKPKEGDKAKEGDQAKEREKAKWLLELIETVADSPGDYYAWSWGLYLSVGTAIILALLVAIDFWLQRRGDLLPPRLLFEK